MASHNCMMQHKIAFGFVSVLDAENFSMNKEGTTSLSSV